MKPTDVKSITYIRVFPTGGWVRRIPLPPTKTLIIPVKSPPLHCHLEKFRPIDSPSPTTQRLIPPLINNLHVITPPPPLVIAPVPFLFLISYPLHTQGMLILTLIDVQYLQKAAFSFLKIFGSSKSLLLRFPPLSNPPPAKVLIPTPTPHGYLENLVYWL